MRCMRTLPARSGDTDKAENAGRGTRIWSATQVLIMVVAFLAVVAEACGPSAPATGSGNDPATGSSAATTANPSRTYALGEFPEFPEEALPGTTAEALQAALDAAVEEGTLTGVTAAVIVADEGSWTGAAGSANGSP